ncbi:MULTISPECIES: DUF6278 family protein [unclassified Streptomyces]|uniref:DUF6278 family protein n=1 Tax=unclassified Streptomyces TaxID=2593676 RepID=UPI001F039240|nr:MULTISPECIES: DUF6278 family protein [unclassified Streptomyces]MCH0567493.1 hypothetical protein [Streptomyces sp. MUM 2J]MCH0573265.1 hypothetical protein [Streptomyces sp. MUM 136J]
MKIPFLGGRRRRVEGAVFSADPEGVTALLAECEVLRSQAAGSGVELDDSAVSLERLDQLVPCWRDDEEVLRELGHDAGLYLGTVVVRTVPGAAWVIRAGAQPLVRLASGREVDVVEAGRGWATSGAPELFQVYAEVAEE